MDLNYYQNTLNELHLSVSEFADIDEFHCMPQTAASVRMINWGLYHIATLAFASLTFQQDFFGFTENPCVLMTKSKIVELQY